MSFVNRRYTKGVPFLSKMVCKRIMGGGGRLVDPLRITLCWVLPIITARSEKLCVLLLLFIVTFYAFCVFSYSIGMLPFSLHLSPLWALPLFDLYKFDISHVTHHMSALDQLKHSCTINRGGRSFPVRCTQVRENLSNFVKNLQTSSCFYRSSNHGLTQSSHQVFNYVAVTKL